MKTPTTALDFYDFFEAIPDEEWTLGKLAYWSSKSLTGVAHCAIGHLNRAYWGKINICVRSQLDAIMHSDGCHCLTAFINDGRPIPGCPFYREPTPKARILGQLKRVIDNESKNTYK